MFESPVDFFRPASGDSFKVGIAYSVPRVSQLPRAVPAAGRGYARPAAVVAGARRVVDGARAARARAAARAPRAAPAPAPAAARRRRAGRRPGRRRARSRLLRLHAAA